MTNQKTERISELDKEIALLRDMLNRKRGWIIKADKKIALLEGLLREARQEVVMPPLKERIDKALEDER